MKIDIFKSESVINITFQQYVAVITELVNNMELGSIKSISMVHY